MKYIYIADFLELIGGAELTADAMLSYLGGTQVHLRCADCTIEKLSKFKDDKLIIGNFTALNEHCKKYISENLNYIKIEYDHQYLKSRNPSIFPNFKAPFDQLINLDFYRNAKAVVCQTKQHLDVIKLNTGLNNLVNFGGSIWTEDQLLWLKRCRDKRYIRTCGQDYADPAGHLRKIRGILDSEIIHKGTTKAINYCKNNGFKYNLLSIKDWKEFIEDLSQCDDLVFFPGVLETCSRIAVEARMLGLSVTGNNLISALKEDWFKLKGDDLISYFIQKNKNIKNFIEDCFRDKKEEISQNKTPEITVILNLYKRPQNLQKQIEAFQNQTVKPKEIWVWQNNDGTFPNYDCQDSFDSSGINGICDVDRKGLIDKWITSNHNWGIFGRFTMAQMAQTEFVCINDDDTIPGPRWLETCLESYSTNPGLQGGIGVVLTSDNYKNHFRIGWAEPRATTEEVDLVGHSWFFPKSYLKYMWMEEPFTWRMEDAHFSYCLQKYGNIKTYVPPQDTKDKSSSVLGYELGVDNVAMSNPANHNQFYSERSSALRHYLSLGWKPLYVTNKKMY